MLLTNVTHEVDSIGETTFCDCPLFLTMRRICDSSSKRHQPFGQHDDHYFSISTQVPPRRQRIFCMPAFRHFIRASVTDSLMILVQVKCIWVSRQNCCWKLELFKETDHLIQQTQRMSSSQIKHLSSSVNSEVEPPAPHVISTKSGSSLPIRSTRSYKFWTPEITN